MVGTELQNVDIFISEEDISERVIQLGQQISKDYQGEDLVVLCVLNGAFMFCSDLVKQINLPIKVDFVGLSSYGEATESSGQVVITTDTKMDLSDKNVLVIEDIVDSGLTMKYFLKLLQERSPKSIKLASLLYKPARNKYSVNIDYLGFEIEDKFVVGYGLDYAGKFRELPYVGILNAGN